MSSITECCRIMPHGHLGRASFPTSESEEPPELLEEQGAAIVGADLLTQASKFTMPVLYFGMQSSLVLLRLCPRKRSNITTKLSHTFQRRPVKFA